jgi:MarR family transcriptional regulator, organic hydroperoxide resistance regulator
MEKTELVNEVQRLHQKADIILRRFSPQPWIELNLTIVQLKSLFFISAKGKTNFKKLAEALGVTPPNVTGIIDRLVEQGLVSRTENPEDRRIMILQATGQGHELLNRLRESRTHQMIHILARLNNEELTSLSLGLNALIKASEAYLGKIEY